MATSNDKPGSQEPHTSAPAKAAAEKGVGSAQHMFALIRARRQKRSKKARQPLPRIRYQRRIISPLMVRIMAVNMFALFTLVGGVFYLTDYRDQLIDARIEEVTVQARTIAGALGESAAAAPDYNSVDVAMSRQIMSRLVAPTGMRARLFNVDGDMVVDSQFLGGELAIVEEQLGSGGPAMSFTEKAETALMRALDIFTDAPDVPNEVVKPELKASDLVEVENALLGEEKAQLRLRAGRQYVINVAIPVQRFRRVLGALLFSVPTDDITAIVQAEQRRTLRVFLAVLAGTLLVTFFLTRTLARPIQILAAAAERVKHGIGREESLPEFGDRRDEIGDLSRSLSAMTRALYNQIDAVERFAADVAHELKNPITSMHSAIETLERTERPDLKERLMAILKEDVRRLERLVTDISDASRLDAELTRGEMKPFDLGAFVSQIVEGYQAMTLPRGITVQLVGYVQDSDGRSNFWVQGIEARLSQVWRNLIDNAISFSPEGGTVQVSLKRRSRMVSVWVDDDGPGLAPGAASKIFKRFYSERPEEEAFGSHSGLGLSISKQIVDAHGGRITAGNRQVSAKSKRAGNVVFDVEARTDVGGPGVRDLGAASSETADGDAGRSAVAESKFEPPAAQDLDEHAFSEQTVYAAGTQDGTILGARFEVLLPAVSKPAP